MSKEGAEETKKGQAHSVDIQGSKQRTKNYHRGKAEDCKTCKQIKNEQQQEEKEKLDEMELYDYEWAEWEKTENPSELEWRIETEQYKQDREQRRINREEEMILEGIEEGYAEDLKTNKPSHRGKKKTQQNKLAKKKPLHCFPCCLLPCFRCVPSSWPECCPFVLYLLFLM